MATKNNQNNKKYKKIILYGFMASGKTTICKLLSKKLNIPFYDTDLEFEKKYGPIYNFVLKNGIKKFRRLEKLIVLNIFKKNNCVISVGGGVFPSKKKENLEIFINTPWKILYGRLKNDQNKRPLLKNFRNETNKTKKLYFKRIKKYMKAKVIVRGNNKNKILNKIIKIWKSN